MQGYVQNKQRGKKEIVIGGRKHKPCINKPTHHRDSIHFENDAGGLATKATSFSEFVPASNDLFLNPVTIAVMLYEDKSITELEKRQTQKEKEE